MTMMPLIAGLLLFLGVHSVRVVAEDFRTRQLARLGEKRWKGLYTLVSIVGFVLIIWGYGVARQQPIVLWQTPVWLRHVAAVLFVSAWPAFAQDSPVIGRIKSTAGSVSIVRQSSAVPARAGQPLYQTDSVRTGADGHVGITLKDETRLALGPNTEVRIDQFLYSPGQGNLRLVLKIARGLVAYVSGRIAKLSPDAVRLETPSAILGVRGTRMVIRVERP